MAGALAAVTVGLLWAARSLDGPWGMLPGGAFRGDAAPCPDDWTRFAGVREVEVEVRPARPRSVTTWAVVAEGALFVPADFLTPWKRWPHQVAEDDRVRLRIGGEIFACRAERVREAERIAALRRAALRKYDVAPDGRAARTDVWWFRMGPR